MKQAQHSNCSHDHSVPVRPAAGQNVTRSVPHGAQVSRFLITEMDCPTEERLIRHKLNGVPGIMDLQFNLMQRVLSVTHAEQAQASVVQLLNEIGFQPELIQDQAASALPSKTPVQWWRLGAALVAATLSEALNWWSGLDTVWVMACAVVALLLSGFSTYRKGLTALWNRTLNINALMAIAVTGAILIGHWPEAAMVMALFALAEAIEARSLDRARNTIQELMTLAPDHANVLSADGQWQDQPVAYIQTGQHVKVRPGERIALDGLVIEGQSAVNQASITGESMPIDKSSGDTVFAGTINMMGELIYEVTSIASHSTLSRIIKAVEQAQSQRAPIERFVDQFARWYTPVLCVLAVSVAIVPPVFFGQDTMDWIYRALVLLVVACPCALVISTPVTLVSGLTAAAHHGIVVKGGAYLESGRTLKYLALDKTGTMTQGRPVQTDYLPWNAESLTSVVVSSLPLLAASLSSRSDHPVSRAITEAFAARSSLPVAFLPMADMKALPGRGIQGTLQGQTYYLGNYRLLGELGLTTPDLEQQIRALEADGKTVVALANTQAVLALFAVSDPLKDTSRQAIAQLHDLGVQTVMLTGDNASAAHVIARQAGVQQVLSELLPEDKAVHITRLAAIAPVGMVGDGINDAPALAQARIGFAMGAAGSDLAIEAADVALMDDDLRKIPAFIRLSRYTMRILKQNIALALGIKAVFLVLTLTGDATLWMAVFADMGASLLVVANGLRVARSSF